MSKDYPSAPPLHNPNMSSQPLPPSYEEALGSQQPGVHQSSHPPIGFNVPPPGPLPTYMHQPQIITPQTIVAISQFHPRPVGSQSTRTTCPNCHAEIDTTVTSSPSMLAYISGAVLALLGCWMGCCLIPCCVDSCLDKEHTCPNCKSVVGTYRPHGGSYSRHERRAPHEI